MPKDKIEIFVAKAENPGAKIFEAFKELFASQSSIENKCIKGKELQEQLYEILENILEDLAGYGNFNTISDPQKRNQQIDNALKMLDNLSLMTNTLLKSCDKHFDYSDTIKLQKKKLFFGHLQDGLITARNMNGKLENRHWCL